MPDDRRSKDRSRRDEVRRHVERLTERERDRRPERRSRSKSVEKRRPRSKSVDRNRNDDRKRRRSVTPKRDDVKRIDRKRPPRENSRSRSREKDHKITKISKAELLEEPSVFASPDMDDIDPDSMAQMMGFTSFDTTKNKKVPGNDVGMASVALKRKYRQYMNRRGGFNRPLDAVS